MLCYFHSQSKLSEVLKRDYTYQTLKVHGETVEGLKN